jgi:site-specific DNA-methyltransferase (adenine-specific)
MIDTTGARKASQHEDVSPHGNTIWQSSDGRSRLYQGDCLEVMASMPANSVDCIWTDPPYNLSNDGITCVAGRMVKVNKGEWDRSRGVELDHEFNKAWLTACRRVLKPNGTIWVSGTLDVYPSGFFAVPRWARVLQSQPSGI